MRLKTILFSFLTLFLFSNNFYAQENVWVEKMMAPNANFYEIQQQFYQDWDGHEYTKGKGWKQFHRWEWFWETRINPDGSFPRIKNKWNAIKDEINFSRGMNDYGGNWTPIGPFNYQNTSSWSPGHGRVNCIRRHPIDSDIIFLGTPVGGIWKTIDGGINWYPVSDDNAVIGIGGITICESNPNVMYATTGDPDAGDTYSLGLLKSTDGGESWSDVGNLYQNLKDVVVNPQNEDEVFIASTGGIYKSIDGGLTWELKQLGQMRNVMFKALSTTSLFAATKSEFYYSNDSGETWNTATGLPDSTSTRLCFDVTEANPDWVYVSASKGNTYGGVFRSTDGGVTFSLRDTSENIFDGSDQAWYDMAIGVSDADPNTLVHGVLNVWRSTDGGTTWNRINEWNNPGMPSYSHADIHFLDYEDGVLYCGSDGGIYVSQNDGSNFSDMTQGLQIGQYYKISGSQNNPNRIAGGLQDNGGYTWDGTNWIVYHGADGMDNDINPTNSNNLFSMIQFGGLRISNDGGLSSNSVGRPEEGNWVTPFQYDLQKNRIVAGYNQVYEYTNGWNQISNYSFSEKIRFIELYQTNTDIIYAGTSTRLYRSDDAGINFVDVTNNAYNLTGSNSFTSLECDPNNPERIWVTIGGWNGSNKVIYSENGGQNWQSLTTSLNFPSAPANMIKLDASSPNNALYVGTDIGVYFTNDDLGTWIPYMTNLPSVIVNDLEINESANIIRAGTYGRGVWESETYPDDMADEDAGIIRIIQPNGDVCGGNIEPKLIIANNGMNDLYSIIIKYQIDSNPPDSMIWNGNLSSFDSLSIQLPSFSSTGPHSFKVWTEYPNNIVDPNNLDDTLTTNFNVVPGDHLLTIQLEQDCMGSETTWSLIDGSMTTIIQGGPYTDENEGFINTHNVCVDYGCYDFVINDAGGDGLAGSALDVYQCTQDGTYWILDENADTLSSLTNANFGSSLSSNFCITTSTPVADFSADHTNFCVDQPINFEDLSSGYPDTWSWSFNGGTPANSSSSNPQVVYSTPGTYEVSLTVSNLDGSDTKIQSTFITIGSKPEITSTVYEIPCFGNCNGAIATSTIGGLVPYAYEWSNQATTDSIGDLCTDNYTLLVTDQNECFDLVQVTLDQPDLLETNIDTTQANCNMNNGSIQLNTTGGTLPYNEDFYGEDPNNLSEGIYQYTVTDAKNCSESGYIVIENINMPSITVETVKPLCYGGNDGSANVIITDGTAPFSIDWGGFDENNLSYGQYTCIVTDDAGCIVTEDFFIYQPSAISMTPTVTHEINGNDGAIQMGVTGGSFPFSYSWDNGASTKNISGLSAGSYTLTVTDDNDCDSSITVIVENHLSLDENEIYGAKIYPNPIDDVLIISNTNFDVTFNIEIIDSRGRQVYRLDEQNLVEGLNIDLRQIESGVYFLNLSNQSENYSIKIIKK